MAGVTDLPFRSLCLRYGAGLASSEMLTADTSLWTSHKSRFRLRSEANAKTPNSVQIVGYDADMMANAAKQAADLGADIIDINMGCPAKKVCNKAAGSALLKDEALVSQILSSIVKAVNIPVTLKIRTGWDKLSNNALNIAHIAENSGIQALTIHGRTRACRFNGQAEYDTIARVKQQAGIPIIANGDITHPAQALAVLKSTGADAVMIGRAAQGQPWIFQQIKDAIAGKPVQEPHFEEKWLCIIEHIHAIHAFYGEYLGVRLARKHMSWYLLALGLNQYRQAFNSLDTPPQQLHFIQQLPHLLSEGIAA